ncbi:hypothetical protein E4A48_11570 [Xanthomonas cerealis pv. cerealis]|uniref:Uncharacterized protein n=1 Tax=Xanthomonas cerealis pv. cerealis TaxID=152263 RepID=A0A514EDX7_9XANT|nr:hypothetical protein [Xanthomonas translucens]QDI04247.1 hypothetical protein E4A48_11570 [Xanthomonas translucens pv. cerealis]
MSEFRNDLVGALDVAHVICGLLIEHDTARNGFEGLHSWQGEAFNAIKYEGRIERMEDHLNAIAERDLDSKTAIDLLKFEMRHVHNFLAGILASWRRWRNKKGQRQEIGSDEQNSRNNRDHRTISGLKGKSKRGLETLKILFTSLIAILAELFPGLKAIFEVAKEGIEHFTT